jgi:nuclease S1
MHTVRQLRCKLLHLTLTFVLLFALPIQALAWDDKGHQIIGALAWLKLSEGVKRQVLALLPESSKDPDGPLAAVSTWADRQKVVYREQVRWHFVSIPLSQQSFDWNRDCANKNCIVFQLDEKKKVLQYGKFRQERAEALMYVVHLVGDIHQPLHCADNNDRGGNTVQVKFRGQATDLHKVWDYDMIEASPLSVSDYARKLLSTPAEKGYWIEDWANDSHRIAQTYVYAIPYDRELGNTYYQRNLPILEQQLAKASEKLVQILDDVFAPAKKG